MVTFSSGARGFCVATLQAALRLTPDGEFGPRTAAAIRALQQHNAFPITGHAGPREFVASGVPWPDEFERCIALTSCLEGTSFGDCNTTDIDGAGVTLGIAGFTTAHGEVQQLLTAFLQKRISAADILPADLRATLLRLAQNRTTHRIAWEQWFYGTDARVRPAIRRALHQWGDTPEMRRLQLAFARDRFWHPAVLCSRRLGLHTPAARAMLLDVWVQNGGWAKRHETYLQTYAPGEPLTLEAMAHAVAACANPRWRHDVLQRKLLFARNTGTVHARPYNLTTQAITPT